MPGNWFEISNDGWRRLNAGRPLGSLVREAVQNAFDEDVAAVSVSVAADAIRIEDDGAHGMRDERLVYTVFLTGKTDAVTKRGRKGRGLKELISACDAAVVETVGTTVRFDRGGRTTETNTRRRGTLLVLQRQSSPADVAAALAALRLIIPPEATKLRVNGELVRRPRHFTTLPGCVLPTVLTRGGVERLVEAAASLELYQVRPGEAPHLFEMGLPIQPHALPWHVDVAQRVPLADGRDRVDESYRLTIAATVLEAVVAEALPRAALRDDWVNEVLAACELSDAALSAYAARALPARAVLASGRAADDRARQAGAKVVDTTAMSRGVVQALARVIETSEAFVERALQVEEEPVRRPSAAQRRALALYEHLGARLLRRQVTVQLMRKPKSPAGHVDDAVFDRASFTLRLNLEGSVDLDDPLAPESLAILFHELAHARAEAHDHRFIRELERIAGLGARLLADEAAALRARFLAQ